MAQYDLYSTAEEAIRWRNTFAGLFAIMAAFFFAVCALHSYERSQADAAVERANARVLKMVEQLNTQSYANPK